MIGGDYDSPKVRLPGAGGAPEIAASCGEVIVIVRQSPRAFVEKVDFVTSVGHGTGLQIAMVTRSGANQYRGTGNYQYWTNKINELNPSQRLTFTPSGLLLAVNSNAGSPAATRLVTINVATGVVANIGNLPDDTDGLAFENTTSRNSGSPLDWRNIALMALGAIALILGLIGWAVGRRAK